MCSIAKLLVIAIMNCPVEAFQSANTIFAELVCEIDNKTGPHQDLLNHQLSVSYTFSSNPQLSEIVIVFIVFQQVAAFAR